MFAFRGPSLGRVIVFLLAGWLSGRSGDLFAAETGNARTGNARIGNIVRTDGPVLRGRLVSVDKLWNVTFVDDKKQRAVVAGKNLVRWGNLPQAGRGAQIRLRGGGLLIAEPLAIGKDRIQVESELFGQIALPRSAVRSVVFFPPSDRRQYDSVAKAIAAAARTDIDSNQSSSADRLVLVNGDQLSGKVQSMTAEVITLRSGGADLPIDLANIGAMALDVRRNKTDRPKSLHAVVGFSDGSRLSVGSLVAKGERASLRLLGGLDLRCKLDQINSIQMFGALATYLSDLKPSGYRHAAYLTLAWDYQTDRSVTGLALRCGKSEYLKGLGMHSASRITYRLDKPYRRLEAELGIDDITGGKGSVVFRVFVDDRSGKWKLRYTSPTIRGGDAPIPIAVDLSGVRQISLLVDFADRGDEMDHADWLDARLVP